MTREEEALKGFLAAALRLGKDELSSLSIEDPHIHGKGKDAKWGILDVRVKTAQGIQIDVEIQLAYTVGLTERIVFYLCSLFSQQLRRGDEHTKLNRTISVIITGFRLTEEKHFANYYTLRNDVTSHRLSDIIQICTLELPKLKADDTGTLSDWMRFFTFHDECELDMLATKDVRIRKAIEMLKYLSEDETLRAIEDSRGKFEMDMANKMAGARREGLAEGRSKGLAEGRRDESIKVARAALAKGLPLDTVADITGLDAATVRRLQKN
jgi:predicted transposase/invertase (TIGR01784 family)